MLKDLHYNCFLETYENSKRKLLLLLSLFLSVFSYGQNHTQLIKTYLSDNTNNLGLSASDIKEWKITNEVFSKQSKVTHVYIQQQYKGIPIFNAVSNISIKDNKVFYFANSFIKDLSSKVNATIPLLKPQTAITESVSQLRLGSVGNILLLEEKNTNKFLFSKSDVSNQNIPVELIYQPIEDGTLKLSWMLNIDQLDGIHWWNIRIDANTGRILQKNDWGVGCGFDLKKVEHNHGFHAKDFIKKNSKSISEKQSVMFLGEKYNVFELPTESPNHGNRNVLLNPQNPIASPFGWHDTDGVSGPEYTITRGNNVYAQLDDDSSNASFGYSPDGGVSLNFDFGLDLVGKSAETYRDASLTNLFYVNNVMHDILYQYGFDEVSGNFQTNNYERGGKGMDPVIADGQDASGRNNANFATPSDGQSPRMQMFIWDDEFLVNIKTGSLVGSYRAFEPSFVNASGDARLEASLVGNPVTADLALMNDESENPTEGCTSGLFFGLLGKIAVIRRGSCDFVNKIENAEQVGAVGVIMVNNQPGDFVMAGQTAKINIPAVSVSQELGESIITALTNGENINVTLRNNGIDGSFDNGIIAHEYGHGISNRLIGGASNTNCMTNQEQLGEGWSDYFGMAITMKVGDSETKSRGVGTFAKGQSTTGVGIRRYPYTTDMTINPFTFKDVKNQRLGDGTVSVHGLGSIWATMLWDLNWKMINVYGFDPDFYNGTGGNNKTMQLVIEGLKLTPCSSGFIGARDAILAADEIINGGVNKCLIWGVFARRGLGFSASSGDEDSFTDQTEAFDMPPAELLVGTNCVLNTTNEIIKKFTIYPNPAKSSINIAVTEAVSNATISIYDINGRCVYTHTFNLIGNIPIDIKNLNPGIYIIKINNESISFSEKLILQ